MTTSAISAPTPIYDLLVQERGDALTASRVAAEQTQDQARRALDWGGPRAVPGQRPERAFSAFGHAESFGRTDGPEGPDGARPASS
ncbi:MULTISPECIES: hypothetical protein [Streptomyces]|uniref:Uncharacterized protein n=1 Tax=Streptomyces cremeus TaxID=66881 RepID=A0ABV5PKC8_STRCM